MKASIIFRLSLVLLLCSLTSLAHAQAAPASRPGYWNTETNLTTRDYTVVRFYNGHDQLMYEELLSNLCLDLSRRPRQRRRIQCQLDLALRNVLRDPDAANHSAHLLATQLGQDRRMQRVYAVR